MPETLQEGVKQVIPPMVRHAITVVHLTAVPLWFMVWYFVGGNQATSAYPILYVTEWICPVLLLLNLFLWLNSSAFADFDKEVARIEFLERYAYYLTTAILGSLVIASSSLQIKAPLHLPSEFVVLESCALMFAMLGVVYIYWIPVGKPLWMLFLRHLKTIPFTYAMMLFVSGVLVLLSWLRSA